MKVRIRNGFSDRNKIQEIPKNIQLYNFTEETRITLKNLVIVLLKKCKESLGYSSSNFEKYISGILSVDVFCVSLESSESNYNNIMNKLYNVFDEGTYDDILSVLEYLANNLYIRDFAQERNYIYNSEVLLDVYEIMNEEFKKEFIGYRFIDKIIVPISNDLEISSINDCLSSKYSKVTDHINKALKMLGDRKNEDYENVIKESICALEGLCSLFSNEETLGKMIEDISKRLSVHPNLKNGIKNLYWFASDEPGIRHENKSQGNVVSFDEAKLVLIEVSGIINYLIPVLENIG